jgi:indolepyruvate ferredoxin oxidoreductase alpha subunit
VAQRPQEAIPNPVRVEVTEKCVACGICTTKFNCPALVADAKGHVSIDRSWCVDCGLCLYVCPKGAIQKAEVAS